MWCGILILCIAYVTAAPKRHHVVHYDPGCFIYPDEEEEGEDTQTVQEGPTFSKREDDEAPGEEGGDEEGFIWPTPAPLEPDDILSLFNLTIADLQNGSSILPDTDGFLLPSYDNESVVNDDDHGSAMVGERRRKLQSILTPLTLPEFTDLTVAESRRKPGALVQLTYSGRQPLLLVHSDPTSVDDLLRWVTSLEAIAHARMEFERLAGLRDQYRGCESTIGPIFLASFDDQPTKNSLNLYLNQRLAVLDSLRYISEIVKESSLHIGKVPARPRILVGGYRWGGTVAFHVGTDFLYAVSRHCDVYPDGMLTPRACDDGFEEEWPYDIIGVVTVSSAVRRHPYPVNMTWASLYNRLLDRLEAALANLSIRWSRTVPFYIHFCGGQSDLHLQCSISNLQGLRETGLITKVSVYFPPNDQMSSRREEETTGYEVLRDVNFLHRILSPVLLFVSRLSVLQYYLGEAWLIRLRTAEDVHAAILPLVFYLLHKNIAEPISEVQGERSYNFALMLNRMDLWNTKTPMEAYEKLLKLVLVVLPSQALQIIDVHMSTPLDMLVRLFRTLPSQISRSFMWGALTPLATAGLLTANDDGVVNVNRERLYARAIDVDMSGATVVSLGSPVETLHMEVHSIVIVEIPMTNHSQMVTLEALVDPEVETLVVSGIWRASGYSGTPSARFPRHRRGFTTSSPAATQRHLIASPTLSLSPLPTATAAIALFAADLLYLRELQSR